MTYLAVGGAITHCASLSGKYKSVLYNDKNEMIKTLFENAVSGCYMPDIFIPRFVSRDEFIELRDTDAYVRYLFSFSCNGIDYMFGREREQEKADLFRWISTGHPNNGVKEFLLADPPMLMSDTIEGRRREAIKFASACGKHIQYEPLCRLNTLNSVHELSQYDIEFSAIDYRQYCHKDGDVVYCDPPYQNTRNYLRTDFNHDEFYEWVATRDYAVYFSSYEISDNRFRIIWKKQRTSTFSATRNDLARTEFLYTNT